MKNRIVSLILVFIMLMTNLTGFAFSVSQSKSESPLYSFGVLSDIHLKDSAFGKDETNSLSDYQRALTFYKEKDVDFIAVSGDIVANNRTYTTDPSLLLDAQNEWVSELKLFTHYNTTYFPDKPVYACVGNHDATPNGFYVTYKSDNADTEGLNIPIIADGYDGTKKAETVWNEITGRPINYVIEHKDDVFIYFSMYYWYYAKFCRDEDIDWLEEKIAQYSQKRIFLFFHLPLIDTFDFTSSNTSSMNDAKAGYKSNYRMGQLLRNNKNIVWFSGHTHYDLALEDTYENLNVYQYDNSATMIHCASGSYTRLPSGDSYINVEEGSQGYIVDVYTDKIVLKGIDFTIGECGEYINTVEREINTNWHEYDNDCDADCNLCGYEREVPHAFDNACDTDCNVCGADREITHTFGDYIYNGDANEKQDGTKTRTCSVCNHTETITAEGTKWVSIFTDTNKKGFYYVPMLWAVSKEITKGTSETSFSPDEDCTRGQIVTFLWRAAGCPEPTTTNMPFADVTGKAFYKKAVLWAVENGITSGLTATRFGPNDPCTRGQIATFLWRAKGKPEPTTTDMPFTDVKAKDYYYKAVLWAVENKITTGTLATTFSPKDTCTRGQIVTFLYRAYN